jgi:hypothetical protein
MDFAIEGSVAPYVYLALLKTSLFFLQRPYYVRERSMLRDARTTEDLLVDLYCALTAFIANILVWGTWALAVYVGYRFGITFGILYFVAGYLGSILLAIVISTCVLVDKAAHILGLFATPYPYFALRAPFLSRNCQGGVERRKARGACEAADCRKALRPNDACEAS